MTGKLNSILRKFCQAISHRIKPLPSVSPCFPLCTMLCPTFSCFYVNSCNQPPAYINRLLSYPGAQNLETASSWSACINKFHFATPGLCLSHLSRNNLSFDYYCLTMIDGLNLGMWVFGAAGCLLIIIIIIMLCVL